jgi:Antibiotic biosynthesis monooxygenase
MAVHYPEPGRREDLSKRMTAMGESLAGGPGLIDVGPWVEHQGARVVGVSRWESQEAFEAAMPGSGIPNDTVHEWEASSTSRLHRLRFHDRPPTYHGFRPLITDFRFANRS